MFKKWYDNFSAQMPLGFCLIEVILRPTLVQSDEPSDLRGSLSPMP